MPTDLNPAWPVLTTYDADHLAHVAMPLGGIGTGTVCLGGRGDLRDWEIVNRPAKGFTPDGCFFALRVQAAGRPPVARAIEGPIEGEYYESARGAHVANHGLPRFRHASFACAYPLAQVSLSDPDVPLDVRIEAFNPLVPADADASGVPVAVMRFVLTNPSSKPVKAAVCGSMLNFIGSDGSNSTLGWGEHLHLTAGSKNNRNRYRTAKGLRGIFMDSRGVDAKSEQAGTMALATTSASTTHCLGREGMWQFWKEFASTGRLADRPARGDAPVAALATSLTVPARSSRAVTFLITWRYPNRMGWGIGANDGGNVGNYYATRCKDAWDVAVKTAAELKTLERRTIDFVGALCASDLPDVVKEAALYNVSSLRTQTTMRTADGRLFGWEGCCDHVGCCQGSCTHVWNYEQAVGFLFGPLSWTMREVEYRHMTRDDGFMNFRTSLPLDFKIKWGVAAADGQMGSLMRLYRDWQLSGDDTALKKLWPRARKAMEFCWLKKSWDADCDGVMEGAQHHTLDSEYFGPNPLTGVWYLGALRACEEIARHLGETDFAIKCARLFLHGSRYLDTHLFNGEYYEHKIIPPMKLSATLPGLIWNRKRKDLKDPECQLGKGCLVDQLVGQYMAHACGLGYLLKAAHVRKTYRSIMKHNFRENFHGHLNISRGFALNDDKGLLMCTYPRGGQPEHFSGCYTECMTGFEYSAAVGMLQEGQRTAGLKCIKAIRDRYDGRTRSPFNEAECGHHYARAMASWGAVLALTGFHYSAVDKAMTFAASKSSKPVTWFWSTGYAWGIVTQKKSRKGLEVQLTVREGQIELSSLTFTGAAAVTFRRPRTVKTGQTVRKVL